jgi:ubiquinol-cytochrome c reductase cytochrome b subunit
VWIFGMLIYLCLMAEAFFGYLLPWGNMSYWGAQVIVSLFGAIPASAIAGRVDPRRLLHLGHHAEPLLRAARVALPLALCFLVIAHILALHEVGSNNPDGVEIKKVKGPTVIRSTAFRSTRTTRCKDSSASACSCRSSRS